MGYWNTRRTLKYARTLLKTAQKLYGKHRSRVSPGGSAALERDISALKDGLQKRDIPSVERASGKLSKSFDKHLGFARKSTFREYGEAFLFAIVLAVVIRTFFLQLFKIPTGSMEPTLHGAREHRWLGVPYGDHILVNKFIYGPKTLDWIGIPMTNWGFEIPSWRIEKLAIRKPRRGDIIVFKYPFHYHCGLCGNDFNLDQGAARICPRCGSRAVTYQNKDFIKRVIGLPGETVEIRDGDIYIDGVRLKEPASIAKNYYVNIPKERGLYGHRGQKVKVPDGHYFVLGDNSASSKDSRFWGFVDFDDIRGNAFFVYLPPWRIGPVG